MALVTQVSDLRNYKLKFSDFGINQAVEQPIPVEPGRTISKRAETVSTGTLGDIITDTRDLEVGRRKDDFTRLKAFLTSGKGVLFASKQAGLDQDLSLEFNPRKRLNDAANTAARLANILLQAGSSGGVRLSSNPFGRYIEARGLVGQIGNLLRADAPSLAIRGKTIIPDYEAREAIDNLSYVFVQNGLVENIDNDTTSLKTLNEDGGGSKFDKARPYTGYAVNPASQTRKGFSDTLGDNQSVRISLISDLSVHDIPGTKPAPVVRVDDRQDGDKLSLKKRLETPDGPGSKFDEEYDYFGYAVDPAPETRKGFKGRGLINDITVADSLDPELGRPGSRNANNYTKSQLNKGIRDLSGTQEDRTYSNIRVIKRENSKSAQRRSGTFINRGPYIYNLGDLSDPRVNKNNNVELIFDAYTAKYAGRIRPIKFIASLENFSDSYSSNWNSTQYIGRGEPVYNFNSTSRAFNFSFKAYSESAFQVRGLYRRLNQLASYTNPTYTSTFMAGTFVKLTLGDYLVRTPGFLSSVEFSWETSYPWEVTGNEDGISDIPKLPHVLNVSISFTPIHDFIPEANPNTVNRAFIATNELVGPPKSPGVAVSTVTDDIPQEDDLVFGPLLELDNNTGRPMFIYEDNSVFGPRANYDSSVSFNSQQNNSTGIPAVTDAQLEAVGQTLLSTRSPFFYR